MPQMMPLSWLTLMFFFILVFLTFNIFNYFSLQYMKDSSVKFFLKNKHNWKW
uniref:ATP synthase complex subunit 8 n=1 Tax=Neocrepidodera brevicollis TaxID=1425586 RepID=A0A3G1GQK5_9CUCU|nr:ATP synthase F0 subunit 8 [Neocrepidodera brevicollis]